ncbi:hypothetical protein PAXRUDRAFT_824691 [Paxillus rubicundulus Ve08.2h10]|uniref:Unplaced genomic scaffold scaffold_103, whole genome shotgun sequence n=1 Tax=Paxillus rubicundulus Ve08.2h10 TaxID=930991 RepID=A0A0D0E1H8_9AGAM|nr:hypothetical protein PAXRUDRAFT_824691 [Paxillus rubicundulus Ve08.2h10]
MCLWSFTESHTLPVLDNYQSHALLNELWVPISPYHVQRQLPFSLQDSSSSHAVVEFK